MVINSDGHKRIQKRLQAASEQRTNNLVQERRTLRDTQHNPKYFANPSKFDPWETDPCEIVPNSFSFLIIRIWAKVSLGPRLAMIEAKLVFFASLRKFSIEMCEKTAWKFTGRIERKFVRWTQTTRMMISSLTINSDTVTWRQNSVSSSSNDNKQKTSQNTSHRTSNVSGFMLEQIKSDFITQLNSYTRSLSTSPPFLCPHLSLPLQRCFTFFKFTLFRFL